VPPEESDLSRVPAAEIDLLLGPGHEPEGPEQGRQDPDSIVPVDRHADISHVLSGHVSQPIELFPYLMLGLLFFLALENLLANKFYKKEEPQDAG